MFKEVEDGSLVLSSDTGQVASFAVHEEGHRTSVQTVRLVGLPGASAARRRPT